MRLHKFRLIALFSFIIAVTAFTSCSSDDDRWINGYVDFAIEPVTDNYGDFYQRVTLDDSFILDQSGRRINPNDIKDWTMTDAWNEISNLRLYGNAVILWFDIEVVGIGTYQYRGDAIELLGEDYDPFVIDDSAYRNLLFKAISEVVRYGAVDIIVRGETDLVNRAEPIYFDFYSDMEFYVR